MYASRGGRGSSGGIDSARSLRTTFLPLLRLRAYGVEARGIDHEVGREVDGIMTIDAVVGEQVLGGGAVAV